MDITFQTNALGEAIAENAALRSRLETLEQKLQALTETKGHNQQTGSSKSRRYYSWRTDHPLGIGHMEPFITPKRRSQKVESTHKVDSKKTNMNKDEEEVQNLRNDVLLLQEMQEMMTKAK